MRRRILIIAASAALLAPNLITTPSRAAEEDVVNYLFVQMSGAVTLADGELRLGGVNPHTLYFSDRPERIVGRVTTGDFVEHWGQGDDSFKADPPNAVLTLHDHDKPHEVAVVLNSPRIEGDSLVYTVTVLDGDPAAVGGGGSLFIDVIGRPLTPLSYAGTARRAGRRTARRVERRN